MATQDSSQVIAEEFLHSDALERQDRSLGGRRGLTQQIWTAYNRFEAAAFTARCTSALSTVQRNTIQLVFI
jgi:hypothetical protein